MMIRFRFATDIDPFLVLFANNEERILASAITSDPILILFLKQTMGKLESY